MAFAQFTDEWVQDKLLFQFMTEGDCSCCGLSMAMTCKFVVARSCSSRGFCLQRS